MSTPLNAPGMDPTHSHFTSPRCTVPRRRWTMEPTGFMMALATRSDDTAVSGGMWKNSTSTGVISAPPPIPVSPTTMPMPNDARVRNGSRLKGAPEDAGNRAGTARLSTSSCAQSTSGESNRTRAMMTTIPTTSNASPHRIMRPNGMYPEP